MRFSGKLHLNRYFFVILPIISCMLFGFVLSIIGPDQFEFDFMVFGQSPNEKKIIDENSPNTIIISATDGNNNLISNNGSTASNSMKFAFSGTDNQGVTISHFECSIDGQAFVTCLSTNTINVADGTHTFRVRSEDKDGNKDSTPASFRWTANTKSSNTQIDYAIDGNKLGIINGTSTRSNSMTLSFSGTDNQGVTISHFECSIDGQDFVTCVSTNTINVADGTHTFRVRSEDKDGIKDLTPASFIWTVDTTPPATSINSAIDGNNNTISKNGNSESRSMKFAFSGTDTGGVGVDHFECNIDNSKFVTCTSPFTFPNLLKDGTHTFKIRSEDNVGNISPSPTSFTWTVDTVPPTTTIDVVVNGNKSAVTNGSNTGSKSMTFSFSANDTGGKEGGGVGINHFECNIDNSKFVTCTSPFIFPNLLKDGSHTFKVLSEDNAGNKDLTPASFTWIVDTVAPIISINTATDGNRNFINTGSNTSSNGMTFSFSGDDSGGKEGKGVGVNHFECSLDDESFSFCTSPVQFTSINLPEGIHIFQIRADDNVGNLSPNPVSFTWTIDTEPPTTSIESSIDGYKKSVTNGGNTSSNSVTFTFSANDTGGKEGKGVGINHFECSIDNSNFTTCTTPLQSNNLTDGNHTLNITSEDNVGNKEPSPSSFNWTVDTVPPTTTIDTALDGNKSAITNGSNTGSNSVTFTFSANDTGGKEGKGVGINHFECSIDDSNFTTCISPIQFTSANISDGHHIFKVFSKDGVGNRDLSPSSFNWTVDTVPPVTSINTALDGNKSAITNGSNTRSTSVIFSFSANDTGGIDHFECSIDSSNFTTCTSPVLFTSANISDGTHTFKVLAEDNSTNRDPSPASFNWTVDTVPPDTSIASATDGHKSVITTGSNTSSNSVTFTFSANDTGGKEGKGVGINHFECSIDDSNFTTCTSPVQFTPHTLVDGSH